MNNLFDFQLEKQKNIKKAISDGVHDALVKAVKYQIMIDFKGSMNLMEIISKSQKNKTDNVAIIEKTMFKAYLLNLKRIYTKKLSIISQNTDIDGNNITIVLLEPPLEN